VPTTDAATGRVAIAIEGASNAPMIPPRKKMTEAPAKEKTWERERSHTLRLKDWIGIFVKLNVLFRRSC
jgi:hypothetical protein